MTETEYRINECSITCGNCVQENTHQSQYRYILKVIICSSKSISWIVFGANLPKEAFLKLMWRLAHTP